MKTTVLTFILILNTYYCYSTNQVKDILYWNNDTLYLYSSPLELLGGIYPLQDENSLEIVASDCWRGYFAEWKIIDNKLFLLNIHQCHTNKNLNKKFERVHNLKFVNGKILADWVNGSFWCGNNLVPEKTLYISIYEEEYSLTFNKGILKNASEFHFKDCEFDNNENLNEFIFSNINWEKLPKLNNDTFIDIRLYIETDEMGNISAIEIEYSNNNKFNLEVIKAIKKLPCLSVYYHEGEFWDIGKSIQIIINQKNLKKYIR